MNLKPHGFTILVDPDPPPDRTDSGRILLPEDVDYVATSGTVVAVGKGSKRLWDVRRKAYEKALLAVYGQCELDTGSDTYEALRRLCETREPAPSVHVGERVVFAAEAGLTVKDEDGHSYILLEEDRVAIIVEEEAEQHDADMMAIHKATRHLGDGFGNSFDKPQEVA